MSALEPSKIRNVAVTGHRGTGKTSIVEAMLFQSGAINRLGSVEQGSTVSDWDEDEHRRAMSIQASPCHVDWQGHKVNLIDTPGEAELPGRRDRRAACRRGHADRRQRGDGHRGPDRPRLGARRAARPRAHVLREHARPRARRLHADARAAARAVHAALRRRAPADRPRARAHGHRRRAAHARVHEPGGPARGGPHGRFRTRWPSSSRRSASGCSTRSSRPTRR